MLKGLLFLFKILATIPMFCAGMICFILILFIGGPVMYVVFNKKYDYIFELAEYPLEKSFFML